MPKFTLICEHENYIDGSVETKTTVEFKKEFLYDVVEEFERFLKASGFVFDGQLEFVKEPEMSGESFSISTDTDQSDYVIAGSVDDIASLTPSSAVFSFDTMLSTANPQDLDFSINTDEIGNVGVIFPEGNNEDIIHFRV